MKSAILDKGERYFTHMSEIFQAIGNEQLKYNWLITDCECNLYDEELYELFSKEYIWISGEQLTEIINKNDFQFIWGVFSGFSKEVNLEEVLKYDLPFADGYKGFWVDNVGIQHPLADIEIVAWDSSLTMFISKNDDLVNKYKCYFPLSEDLSAQNKKQNYEIAHIEQLIIKELEERDIVMDEGILHQKYLIWRMLYLDRNKLVNDEEIFSCIRKILNRDK